MLLWRVSIDITHFRWICTAGRINVTLGEGRPLDLNPSCSSKALFNSARSWGLDLGGLDLINCSQNFRVGRAGRKRLLY